MSDRRPFLSSVRPYTWDLGRPTAVRGIVLNHGNRAVAHLTPDEALELSNRLVDLVEQLEQEAAH